MGLRMGERRALTEQVARRYRQADRKEKAVILGEFVQTTGYTRKYAIHLLNSWGRTRLVQIDGRMVKLVVGHPRRAKRRARPRRYDQEVLKALRQIWYVFDFMCGKGLVVVLRTMLPVLDSFGEIPLTAEVRAKLLPDADHHRRRHRLGRAARAEEQGAALDSRGPAGRTPDAADPDQGIDTDNGSEFINHHLVATAASIRSASRGAARTARTTPATSSRRVATWSAARSVTSATTPTRSWPPSTPCTAPSASWSTSSTPRSS